MTTTTTTDTPALSQRLRQVSFGGHTDSGDSGPSHYYDAYTRGGLTPEGAAAQAVHHYYIYRSLEQTAEKQRERLGDDFAFWLPELHRLPSLRADLEHWLGDGAVDRIEFPEGLRPYTDRIDENAGDSLPHYVAHQYTRYLADLSGGQQIGEMHRRAYGLERGAGATFYEFSEIPDPAAFKVRYRELLDAASFSEDEIRLIEDEVRLAYRMNNQVFADLDARFEEYRA
ncbi:MAG: heme oxygenase (biliverdin-producing) [Microbacteriaceae bacterium]|uniref:biliverdin-producing heme oxygenase n=1 Tax=Microbacterium sp. TaxID=51671 RepID=UPI003F9C5676